MLFTRGFKREVEIAFVIGGIGSAVELIYNSSKNACLKEQCKEFEKLMHEGKKQQAFETGLRIVRLAGLQEKDMYSLTELKKYRKKLVTSEFIAEVNRLSKLGRLEVVKYIEKVFTKDAGIRKLTNKYLDIYEFGDPNEADRIYRGLLGCLGLSKLV